MSHEQSPVLTALNNRAITRPIIAQCEQRVSLLDQSDQHLLLGDINEQLAHGGVLLLDSHQKVPWPDRPLAMTDIIASMYALVKMAPNVQRIAVPVAGVFHDFPILNRLFFRKLDGGESAPIKTVPVYSSRRELNRKNFWGLIFTLCNGVDHEAYNAKNQMFHTLIREELNRAGTLVVMSVFGGLNEIGKGELPRKMHETMTSVSAPIFASHSHLQRGRFTTAFERFYVDPRSMERTHVQNQINQTFVRLHQRIIRSEQS
jgi:hypothetical protein